MPMEYESVSDVFDEMVALSPAYSGPGLRQPRADGKLYPNADPEHSDGTVVLFDESFATDDGKAHLVPAEWMPAKELPTTSTRSCSTRAGCSSTGTPAR